MIDIERFSFESKRKFYVIRGSCLYMVHIPWIHPRRCSRKWIAPGSEISEQVAPPNCRQADSNLSLRFQQQVSSCFCANLTAHLGSRVTQSQLLYSSLGPAFHARSHSATISTCVIRKVVYSISLYVPDQWPIIYRLSMISYLRIRLSCVRFPENCVQTEEKVILCIAEVL